MMPFVHLICLKLLLLNIHPFSTTYPGSGDRDSSLSREAQAFLTPSSS